MRERLNKKGKVISFSVTIVLIFSSIFLIAGALSLSSQTNSINEWLMFGRNFNHTGYYPASLNMTEFGKLWSYSLMGFETMIGSPVTANDMIYFAGTGGGTSDFYAVNITNQSLMWSYSGTSQSAGASLAGGMLYLGTSGTHFISLNATNGSLVWDFNMNKASATPATASVVYNGAVYFGGNSFDSTFYSLNATNGSLIWSYSQGSGFSASPAVADGTIYTGNMDLHIYALNATNGNHLWNYSTTGYVSSPTVANGMVYFGCQDYNVYALNATNGSKIWNYTGTNRFDGNSAESAPSISKGILYIGSIDNNFYALNATTGNPIWNYTTGYFITTSPASADNVVFAASQDNNVYGLNPSNGSLIWSYSTGGGISSSSPIIANNTLYLGSSDGKLYAFTTGAAAIGNYTCSDYTSCSTAITNAKAGDFISMDASFFCGEGGTCLTFTNKNNITFDCKENSLNSVNIGILLTNSNNNTRKNCIIKDDNKGIYLSGTSNGNLFYNNFLMNTINYYNDTNGLITFFNTSKTTGTNIAGGIYIGGNFWGASDLSGFSQTCTDANSDGICDSSYLVDQLNSDYLPLLCYESWTCSDWGDCSGGIQTRTCTDNRGCGTTRNKPTESRTCSVGGHTAPTQSQGGAGGGSVTVYRPIINVTAFTPVQITINSTKMDLTGITLSLKKEVSNASMNITKVDQTEFLLFGLPIGKLYQLFQLEPTGIESNDILNATLSFRINKTFLAENNITFHHRDNRYWLLQNDIVGNIAVYRMPTGASIWGPLVTNYTGEDNESYYFRAYTPGFSTFAIFFNKYDCLPNSARCSENNVQICLGNATWLVTDHCSDTCENGKCTSSFYKSGQFHFLVSTIVIGIVTIVLILLFSKKKVKEKKKKKKRHKKN